jgi:hypothetical protein
LQDINTQNKDYTSINKLDKNEAILHISTSSEDYNAENVSQELADIHYEEKYHFTLKRYSFIILNFAILLTT